MMPSIGSRNTKRTEQHASWRTGRASPAGHRHPSESLPLYLQVARRLGIIQQPLSWPGVTLPPRPGLLLLVTVLLVSLCAVLAVQSVPHRVEPADGMADEQKLAESAEFSLQSDDSSSNLNSTSAELAVNAIPVTAATRDQGIPVAKAESARIAPPQLDPGPEIPTLPLAAVEPAREDCYSRRPLQGDTPMTRTWKLLGLSTLLAATLSAAPSFAEGPTDSEKLTEIQKQLTELKVVVADVQKSVVGLSALEKKVDNLQAETILANQTGQDQIKSLKQELSKLRDEVENLRTKLSAPTRISSSPPAEVDTTPSGRVVMLNTYPTEMTIRVNTRSYHLAPGETRLSEPIPAGTFTYEVLGVIPPRTRTVAANQAFTVHVHPL